jgi:hypothetical protein
MMCVRQSPVEEASLGSGYRRCLVRQGSNFKKKTNRHKRAACCMEYNLREKETVDGRKCTIAVSLNAGEW